MADSAPRIARLATFATLGAVNVAQECVRVLMQNLPDADPEVVTEESLCLAAAATARAAAVGLREVPDAAAPVQQALLGLPFLYRDYLIGGAMLEEGDEARLDADQAVYARLERKMAFYTVHLPEGQFPGERALKDKMGLWMGRVSPPGLPEMPTDRLARLGLVGTMLTHLKLVLAFARNPEG